MINPQTRQNLVSEAMGDGLGVFDPQLQKSYILNATSALVFQHADGETTPEQLTDRVGRKFNVARSEAEQMVWLALGELEKSNLLQEKVTTTQAPRHLISRRQVFTAFAAAGLSLALLPVVAPLSVPNTSLMAAPVLQSDTTTPPPVTTTTTPPPPPVYSFTGFFAPVDNQPVVNEVKAGRSIPVKFSLNGDHGLNIIASGYPISYPVACGGGYVDPIGDSETTTSPSGLSYDASSDQYTYVWKTDKSWAGSCRTFQLRLTDPSGQHSDSNHFANFSFK
ncbi:MAG: PqqD family peptide modification chaperone [Caldilineaceae bacterium]